MAVWAYWTTGPGQGELREEARRACPQGGVRVRARYGAISRGTEALVHAGRVPESEVERMRAPFQEGTFPWPVKYGYATVGEVVQGPAPLRGREVFCLHPHQTEFVLPAEAVHPLPPDVPAERAVLAANMETALNAIWDSRLGAGDGVSVVGAGVVGLLITHLAAAHPGCELQVVDVDADKASVAGRLGGAFALPERAEGERDVVFHASGTPDGLRTALALAGSEARVVEVSWHGDREASLPLGGAFHSRRLQLVGSQVGQLPSVRRPRWDHGRRLRKALELLRDPRLDQLFTGQTDFRDLPRVMPTLCESARGTLCHRIVYEQE